MRHIIEKRPGPIVDLLATMPKMDSITSQLMIIEEYDQQYGIYDHNREDRPLALMAMHPKEQYTYFGPRAQKMARFMFYNLTERFGLSWAEFIQQTRADCELQLALAAEYTKHLERVTSGAEAAARDATGKK